MSQSGKVLVKYRILTVIVHKHGEIQESLAKVQAELELFITRIKAQLSSVDVSCVLQDQSMNNRMLLCGQKKRW